MALEKKSRKKPPKVRSYVRPTKVHTPRPRKKQKYPLAEVEELVRNTFSGRE